MHFFAPDAAFWSEPEQVLVSIHDRASDPEAWDAYVAGIQQCYGDFGAGHIVGREQLDREPCQLFWLFSGPDGQVLGGVRAVGPVFEVDRLTEIPAVVDLAISPTAPLIHEELVRRVSDGLVEAKGAWTAPGVKGLGGLTGRFVWHCSWWFSVGHTVGTSGIERHTRQWEERYGALRIPGAEPAADFPITGHQTIPLLWSADREAELPDALLDQLAVDRAYLHPLRNRVKRQSSSGIEVLVGPRSVERLGRDGVELRSLVDDLNRERVGVADEATVAASQGWPWIHYPWRNTAVQVLDPAAYHRRRTDRNRHKLTGEDLASLRRKKIGVVGLSVGHPIAYVVAQEGLCGQLRLADFDRLELTNLNRLPASLLDHGELKTTIAARRIAELDPFLDVQLFDDGLNSDNVRGFLTGLDLVIEECDSLDVKLMVREAAAELGIPVLMESNDRGLLDVERFDLDPTRPPFHGLIPPIDASELAGLTTDEKVPYVLGIIDAERVSTPLAASMVEIDRTLVSWPQLASDVALGAALTAHAARNILLGRSHRSGRVTIDLDAVAVEPADPPTESAAASDEIAPPVRVRAPLPEGFEDAVLEAASLAPSGGNMQPWRFELTADRFSVHAAGDPVGMDIAGRGTAVACGAALFNALCVAAARSRLGGGQSGPGRWDHSVDLDLDLDQPDRMAALNLGRSGAPELAELVPLIPYRVTNRQLDPSSTPLPSQTLATLTRAAEAAGGGVRYVPSSNLGVLTDCWAESDRLRFLTERLHREMFDEIRRPGIDDLDRGLDQRTLELTDADLATLALLRRPDVSAMLSDWDAGHRLGDDIVKRLRQSAGLLVVTVDGATQPDYVRGGMALQRLWLEAARLDVGLQPISPVFGYAQRSSELTELLGRSRGEHLDEIRATALTAIGLEPGQSFVLAMRAHLGSSPSAISRRAPLASVVGSIRAMNDWADHSANPSGLGSSSVQRSAEESKHEVDR